MTATQRAIESVWIHSELYGPVHGGAAGPDDNTDVIVTFADSTRYVASFFTYGNIENLRRKNRETGECLSGKYFWASDMILIDRLDRAGILLVIEELLRTGEFASVFSQIPE